MPTKPQNPPPEAPQSTATGKSPRGKPFTGKDDPRNRQNVEKSFSAETVDTLAAMRHVVAQPSSADRTHQQRSMREWKSASPTSFFGRLADLEKAELAGKPSPGAAGSPVKWDGEGPCPACNRPPEPEQDGPEYMEPEWDVMMRLSRHLDKVTAFLDREGLK